MRFDQCLRAFAAGLRHQVNITAIVGMSGENRPKSVVFGDAAAVGVGHFGLIPKSDRVSAHRSQGSHRALSCPSSDPGGLLLLS